MEDFFSFLNTENCFLVDFLSKYNLYNSFVILSLFLLKKNLLLVFSLNLFNNNVVLNLEDEINFIFFTSSS